jgi:VWFA-related protein
MRQCRRRGPWIAVLICALSTVATAETSPGAFELWQLVQEHYRNAAAYRDRGVLEVARPGEEPLRFSFTTAAGPGGAFHFELVPEGAAPGAARRLWRTAGGEGAGAALLYDAGRGEYAAADPVAVLARLGGPGGLDALLVPALLAGAGDSLPRPAGAVVEGAEPCGGAETEPFSAAAGPSPPAACHRLTLALPAGELRLWVGSGEPAVWRLELRRSEGRDAVADAAAAAGLEPRGAGGAPGGQSVVRVWHRHEPADRAAPPRAAELAPPPEAERVVELSIPATAPAPVAAPRPAGGSDGPAATFGEVVNVRLATFVVRVLDGDGEPIRGLGPEDFVVSLGEERVPVAAVDWISSAYPEAGEEREGVDPAEAVEEPAAAERAAALPGKLVVLFVQADFNALRIHGHLKLLPFVRDLLDSLAPGDRVALVSFDSHLKLWRDFTTDREAVHGAVYQAVRFGNDPPQLRDSERRRHRGPSLAARLDPAAAKDAPWAEKGLELLAEALAPLPGEKAIVFLGWGLGRWGFGGFRPRHGYWQPAVDALARANATVFVLDIADAASHTLEIGLRQIAAATGGTYDKTAVFPVQATKRLARLLGGYYLLTVDADAPVAGDLDVQLTGLPRGARVLMRPLRVETATRP